MAICTLLTDFGLSDYYVAAVKGTLLRLAPGTQLVDISHSVEAGNVHAAGHLLAAALPSFPDGTVHLSVVDPGVGSERRLLAVAVKDQLCVAPDNGLLTPVLANADVHEVTRADLFQEGAGETFHGRDRLAPIAAFLLRGGSLHDLGPVTEPLILPRPDPVRAAEYLYGEVVHVDHFGNAISNIPSGWLTKDFLGARIGDLEIQRYARFYAELEIGEAAVLPGSTGTLEAAMRDCNLAQEANIRVGAQMRIALRP